MRLKNFITLSLFLAISFSVMHDFALSLLDHDHCSSTEYINETNQPSAHGDVCDIHYKFHQAISLLAQKITLPKIELDYLELALIDVSYYFNNPRELFKPPIA